MELHKTFFHILDRHFVNCKTDPESRTMAVCLYREYDIIVDEPSVSTMIIVVSKIKFILSLILTGIFTSLW